MKSASSLERELISDIQVFRKGIKDFVLEIPGLHRRHKGIYLKDEVGVRGHLVVWK